MSGFPAEVLERLAAAEEVEIEVKRPSAGPGTTRRVVIWIVVDGTEVFVRSVRGERGAWYRALLRDPEGVIHVDGTAIPVRATLANDQESIERTTRALERKYRRQRQSLAAMTRPLVLEATLRLDPA